MVAKKNINSAFYCFCRVTVSNATKCSTFFFSRRLYVTTTHCMCEGWKKAQKSVTLSQKKPRDKFWPEMNLRRRELSSKKEKKEREGTPPLIPTFTILLFQTGKNARERKAISNKNLTTSTTKGILLHLLESLSPISLWKATALGFIFIVQKNWDFTYAVCNAWIPL